MFSACRCVFEGVYDRQKTKTDGGLNDEAQCDQKDTSITVGADKGVRRVTHICKHKTQILPTS